jgi:hypothetical protein
MLYPLSYGRVSLIVRDGRLSFWIASRRRISVQRLDDGWRFALAQIIDDHLDETGACQLLAAALDRLSRRHMVERDGLANACESPTTDVAALTSTTRKTCRRTAL